MALNSFFRRSVRFFLIIVGLVAVGLVANARPQNFSEVKPSPQQVAWQDLEIGVLIHFGTNTFLDREWGDGTADPKIFSPGDVNPAQWMQAAKSAGAATLNYGLFMNAIFNFIIVAFGVFLLVRQVNRFRHTQEVEMKECPFCLSGIVKRAKRCPFCTSGLEDKGTQVTP